MKELRWVTGGCCQWHDSASYDSDEVTVFLKSSTTAVGVVCARQMPLVKVAAKIIANDL